MKKILFIVVAALCAVACNNDTPTPTPPPSSENVVLTLTSEDSVWFDAEGGDGVITYTLENAVDGTIKVEKDSDNVKNMVCTV